MSEMNKNAEERKPYAPELEEPLKFEHDVQASILTSTQLGDKINEYFRLVFPGDYEGCKFEIVKNVISPSLIFRHPKHVEGEVYGVEMSSAKKTNNSTLNRIRTRDFQAQYGDRYSLTQDGEDVIKPLLQRQHIQNNGKVNWSAVISEYSEPTYGNFYSMKNEQYTKVSGLDINLLCSVLFGRKDADGNKVIYLVDMKGTLNQNIGYNVVGANQVYILWINRINYDKLCETYNALGIGSVSSIIR